MANKFKLVVESSDETGQKSHKDTLGYIPEEYIQQVGADPNTPTVIEPVNLPYPPGEMTAYSDFWAWSRDVAESVVAILDTDVSYTHSWVAAEWDLVNMGGEG